MKSFAFIVFALSSGAFADITEQTKDFTHDGVGNDVVKSHLVLRDGKIVVSTVDFATPDGVPTQRNHILHVAGEMVAILEDNGADGTLDGVSVFDTKSGDMEYLYVQDGLKPVPANSDEMAAAEAMGDIATSFMEDAVSGEGITSAKVAILRFRVWLLKWDPPMFLVFALVAVAGYIVGRRSPRNRSEHGESGKASTVTS